jgi:6-pyruvoyl-tetrahydropterin synthase
MYEVSVEREFCAAHAITIRGVLEPLHGHNFHVTATLSGNALDADGMLTDFHAVAIALDAILAPMRNANLNEVAAFMGHERLPSAERIAAHIGAALVDRLGPALRHDGADRGVRVARVRVTEAPGCAATWIAG